MTKPLAATAPEDTTQALTHAENLPDTDWPSQLSALGYAYGKPACTAVLKSVPADFQVTEIMDIEPTGEGEHYWLDITKTKCTSEQVAKALARFSGVAYRDVGYSGLKDYFAEARQWFSVWMPHAHDFDWGEFTHAGVVVHHCAKHSRKIKRGTHRANRFKIILRNVAANKEAIESRLHKIQQAGVPNYFGPQRFGRSADNMRQACDMLLLGKRVNNRSLRSILLSSARSWVFNAVLSARVTQGTWQQLQTNEPANLNGTNSMFISDGTDVEQARLTSSDIHPTAPMWGEGSEHAMAESASLHQWELAQLHRLNGLMKGLEQQRLKYQRRATRTLVADLSWQFDGDQLCLEFQLARGQFATSVIRELVLTE